MTRPADPSRQAAPTVREIAALTARLRAISANGRTVDPAERAQFLADKRAILDRIEAENQRGFDELGGRHPLPGDGGGDWVTDRNGTRWVDLDGATDDDISVDIPTANPDIWDAPQPLPGPRSGDPLSCLDTRSPSDLAMNQAGRAPGRATEHERREQLARWHAEDQVADAADTEWTVCCVDPAQVRSEGR